MPLLKGRILRKILFFSLILLVLISAVGYYLLTRKGVEFVDKEGFLGCPVPEQYCAGGKAIYAPDGNIYLGIGFRVPDGTPLLASLEGTLGYQTLSGGVWGKEGVKQVLYQRVVSTNYAIYYIFEGSLVIPIGPEPTAAREILQVPKGQKIADLSGVSLADFTDVNIIFGIEELDENDIPTRLNVRDFLNVKLQ